MSKKKDKPSSKSTVPSPSTFEYAPLPVIKGLDFQDRVLRIFQMESGRDKICRFIQYFFMFLAPIMKDMGMFEVAAQLDIVRSYMSFVRAAMRFEKPYPLLKNIS